MGIQHGGGYGEGLSPRAAIILTLVVIAALTLLWATHRGPVGDIPERHLPPPEDTTETP